jgi:pilus assembly protein Flp/PilA
MSKLVKRLVRSEEGQDLVEYGLLVGLITVATVTLISTIGTEVRGLFQDLIDAIP